MGNPTSYLGSSLTWEGKQLKTVGSTSYAYDENGLRTQKTVSGTTTNYYYNGSVLISLVQGSNTLLFSYDATGKVSAVNFNGTYYYYIRNGQGDVIKLIDNSGTAQVTYSYDTWGKQISCGGSLANTLGKLNPFRYRGYVYDEETGWYYLQSRYYNPTVGRFLSADVMLSTGQGVLGHNTYAYCLNNPSSRTDCSGNSSVSIPEILIVVIAIILATTTGCSNSNPYGIETTNNGNCYEYATGLPYSIFDGGAYYPGCSKRPNNQYRYYTETDLQGDVQNDFNYGWTFPKYSFSVSLCKSTEELTNSNEWLIAYCYSDNDFHFLRKDYGIGWTHKQGWTRKPTNLDWSGEIITHPKDANLGPYDNSTLLYLKIIRTEK